MGKVSFSDGLAIAGLILAIVLVVLDKAGKLKGPRLLALLGVAACMAIPLLFSVPWVSDSQPGLVLFARRALMISLLGSRGPDFRFGSQVAIMLRLPRRRSPRNQKPRTLARYIYGIRNCVSRLQNTNYKVCLFFNLP